MSTSIGQDDMKSGAGDYLTLETPTTLETAFPGTATLSALVNADVAWHNLTYVYTTVKYNR